MNFDIKSYCLGIDADGDTIYNFYDLDSDNDGIYDAWEYFDTVYETSVTDGYDTNNDGLIDPNDNNYIDANQDGLKDGLNPLNQDFDNDSTPNYLDLDSDNDGFFDAAEAGYTDAE